MYSLLHSTFMNGPLHQADVSFIMEEGGRPFLEHQADLALIPASNMKLLISSAALLSSSELMPPLQTFASGKIKSGVLQGDLILDSCGRPIFSARFPVRRSVEERNKAINGQIAAYVRQLKNAGVNKVSGSLTLSFNRWNGPAENSHYTASAALSFNENTLDTFVKEGQMKTSPAKPQVFKVGVDRSVKSQDKVKDNLIRYNPAVDSQDYWRISHSSAIEYSRLMIQQYLEAHGIEFLGEKNIEAPKALLFETEPLERLPSFIGPMNTWSDNYRAELLALQLTRVHTGKAEYEGLNPSLHTVFKENNLQLNSLLADDGSGLSRKNRISAADINKLLKFMQAGRHYSDFKNSLALAGKTGTLRKRFKGTPFEGCFYGKSGTLDGVSALSGYWLRQKRPPMTFSFIGNGADNKLFWDALEKFAASMLFMT